MISEHFFHCFDCVFCNIRCINIKNLLSTWPYGYVRREIVTRYDSATNWKLTSICSIEICSVIEPIKQFQ
jgi:hypothetical protein